MHPGVASSLNELGNTAAREHKYNEAEQYFTRMVAIYYTIYGDHHYLAGIATSSLAGAYAGKQQWARAEALFRDAVQIFSQTQSPTYINTRIVRTKLGHVLLAQKEYCAAEAESRTGYDILINQIALTASWLVNARKDLIEEYDALHQSAKFQHFRAELASLAIKPSPAPIAK